MIRAATLLTLVLSATVAQAKRMPEPPPVTSVQLDATAPLPAGIKAKGKRVIAAWKVTGPGAKVGYLVLSSTETTSRKSIGPGRKLYAQLYAGAKPKQVRLVQDGFDGCNVALRAAFVAGSTSFEDLDGDGIPEVAFAYDLACDMGEGATTRKLLILEGPAKYALRGQSLGRDPVTGTAGDGAYKAEGMANEGAISAWAEARWDTLLATAPLAVDP